MISTNVWRLVDRHWLRLDAPVAAAWIAGTSIKLPVICLGESGWALELPSFGPHFGDVGRRTLHLVDCNGGVQDHVLPPSISVDCEPLTDRLVEPLLGHHLDLLMRALYPTERVPEGLQRCDGCAIAQWSSFSREYWAVREPDAPVTLIVQLAQEIGDLLRDITTRPRRMLRRERRLLPLDRIQQLDNACLRWYVRQPGSSVVEKAGARQELLGVVRTETADTHENRVVRETLEMIRRECANYLTSYGDHIGSPRVLTVRRLGSQTRRWLRESEIGRVPRPTGEVHPNYVLQFDRRYSQIWPWFVRLRSLQDDRLDARRWPHRVFAEHVSLALAATLDKMALGNAERYDSRMILRLRSQFGQSVDDRTELGPWIMSAGRDGHLQVVYLLAFGGQSDANLDLTQWRSLQSLLPDAIVLANSADAVDMTDARALCVWSAIQAPDDSMTSSQRSIEFLDAELRMAAGERAVGILIIGGLDASTKSMDTTAIESGSSCRAVHTTVPIHLDDSTFQDALWMFLRGPLAP